MPKIPRPVPHVEKISVARFWSYVNKLGQDECWSYTGGTDSSGYGVFSLKDKEYGAHRVAWTVCIGEIPIGQCVLHKCDNPPCCNPKHLFLGTDDDNQKDRKKKGRSCFGERCGRSKLTDADVIEIRTMYRPRKRGFGSTFIGRRFGVSDTMILDIIHRKNWTHLP